MGWPNDKGLPPHNANTPGNLEFAPGIREFAQNTLLGENDSIWQPCPQKCPKHLKRTGTVDVIFNFARSAHHTDGSSSEQAINLVDGSKKVGGIVAIADDSNSKFFSWYKFSL